MTDVEVAKIGTGTREDPYRPDIPSGISWSCVDDRENTMVVRVSDEVAAEIEG